MLTLTFDDAAWGPFGCTVGSSWCILVCVPNTNDTKLLGTILQYFDVSVTDPDQTDASFVKL